jgi:sodium transport system permease protein
VQVQLFEDHSRAASRNATDFIADRLNAVTLENYWQVIRRLSKTDTENPYEQARKQVPKAANSSSLIGVLPLILLLMTVTGGVYPAIDLTAGERERNTLETLISLPVPRFRLLLAKFAAVVLVTLLTGIMNLIAMSVTLYVLQLDKALLGPNGFTLGLATKLMLALSAFALFYSALLLMLTSSARSFKEAQAYLIPLLMLSIGPGMVILLPGWKLSAATSVVPLINVLLLSKQFLEGTPIDVLLVISTVVTTMLYAVAALSLAAQIFGADAVAVGSRGSLIDLLRPASHRNPTPSLSFAMLGLAMLFPAYFVASGLLNRLAEEISFSSRILFSAVLTIILFALYPIGLLLWERVPIRHGLSLRLPAWSYWLAAIFLGVSAWPWIFEIIVTLQSVGGLAGIDLSKFEVVEKLLLSWQQVPLPLIILGLGVAPGVCEECFFRGFLFNGLKKHMRGVSTIILTAIAFGLFHVVLAGGAAPERVLPSTLMGLLLGWLRWRSASLLPGIILHAIHNSSLLTMAKFRDELAGWGLSGVQHQNHLPALWLIVSAIGLLVGLGLALFPPRNNTFKPIG